MLHKIICVLLRCKSVIFKIILYLIIKLFLIKQQYFTNHNNIKYMYIKFRTYNLNIHSSKWRDKKNLKAYIYSFLITINPQNNIKY